MVNFFKPQFRQHVSEETSGICLVQIEVHSATLPTSGRLFRSPLLFSLLLLMLVWMSWSLFWLLLVAVAVDVGVDVVVIVLVVACRCCC